VAVSEPLFGGVPPIEAIEPPSKSEIKVRDWRMYQLIKAGYSVLVAGELAVRRDVDLHQACELLASGCPLETAARILL
jgi:hypothetical protein